MGLGADLIVCDGWLGAGLLGGLGAFIAVPGLLGFGRGEGFSPSVMFNSLISYLFHYD